MFIITTVEAQEEQPPGYHPSSAADNDYHIVGEGRTIFDIRRNTNRQQDKGIKKEYLSEDVVADEQGDLFDSFDLNQFYSSNTTDTGIEASSAFLDAREIVEGNNWDEEEEDKKEDGLIQTLLSSSTAGAISFPILPSPAKRMQHCWGEWQPPQHEPYD